jgi:hypothetical protein
MRSQGVHMATVIFTNRDSFTVIHPMPLRSTPKSPNSPTSNPTNEKVIRFAKCNICSTEKPIHQMHILIDETTSDLQKREICQICASKWETEPISSENTEITQTAGSENEEDSDSSVCECIKITAGIVGLVSLDILFSWIT